MDEAQGKAELSYRVGMLKVQKLLEDKLIDTKEYKKLQKALIKIYEPIIGWLDE